MKFGVGMVLVNHFEHTVDIVVADRTRWGLVKRIEGNDPLVAPDARRQKEAHYQDSTSGTKFVPFALDTNVTLSAESDRFFRQVCIFNF